MFWFQSILVSAVAIFFLDFGIREMGRAYKVDHPSDFLASFFSSSFIILISGTLLVAFIWRMIYRVRQRKKVPDDTLER